LLRDGWIHHATIGLKTSDQVWRGVASTSRSLARTITRELFGGSERHSRSKARMPHDVDWRATAFCAEVVLAYQCRKNPPKARRVLLKGRKAKGWVRKLTSAEEVKMPRWRRKRESTDVKKAEARRRCGYCKRRGRRTRCNTHLPLKTETDEQSKLEAKPHGSDADTNAEGCGAGKVLD